MDVIKTLSKETPRQDATAKELNNMDIKLRNIATIVLGFSFFLLILIVDSRCRKRIRS
jgi:hypothetical protein